MASLSPFGDTEYTSSLPAIAQGLGISYGQAQLTMTVYLAGFALNQIFYGGVAGTAENSVTPTESPH